MRTYNQGSLAILLATLAAGCSSGPTTSPTESAPAGEAPLVTPAASAVGVDAAAASREEWRRTMSKVQAPKDGCFTMTHPSTTWVEVPCAKAPNHPLAPARGGPRPMTVGNGGDLSSEVSGIISWAEGSFPSVSGVSAPSGAANSYSLQLNTQTFTTSECSSSPTASTCKGWQQFVYEGAGGGFIQYWLIGYNGAKGECPTGWTTGAPLAPGDCYRNSDNATPAPAEAVTSLGDLTVTGTAGASDTLTVSVGNGVLYQISQASILGLSEAWTSAEFNVFGDSSDAQAVFNSGSSILVQTLTDSTPATTNAPTCDPAGFTGETNNLTIVPHSCHGFGGSSPGIRFFETSTGACLTGQCAERVHVVGDYTGTGLTDLTVWLPSNGDWNTVNLVPVQWGTGGDIPVTGDYDGDGTADRTVFRPSDGTWYVAYSSNGQSSSVPWGTSGDVPAPGDYDGDGKADLAVWRPSTGDWYIIYSATGVHDQAPWGTSGDIPVAGDYDGDGETDLATWRPSNGNWYVTFSSNGTPHHQQWGESGDVPAPGDYDGDGTADLAVWRPSTGTFYVMYSSTGATTQSSWGTSGDVPVPGDYDGDGKTDLAVWRPSNGYWYVTYSSNGTAHQQAWGASGDVPVLRLP